MRSLSEQNGRCGPAFEQKPIGAMPLFDKESGDVTLVSSAMTPKVRFSASMERRKGEEYAH